MAERYVYAFGGGAADGDAGMKEILGGKGANLAEMARLGLPVPPGFTISAEVCRDFFENDRTLPVGVWDQVDEALAALEEKTGKRLGDPERPLLVSVRSGAAISMPGMMDTVLNIGLNRRVATGLASATGNERFVWDLYRRLVNMFGDVVMGIDHEHFESIICKAKEMAGVDTDSDLTAEDLKALTERYLAICRQHTGEDFPSEPRVQLRRAIKAVFRSWETPRSLTYRRIRRIRGLLGTAVNVQAMVYGNLGETSGTGVFFTRDPSTGENVLYGEFLMNAQGEDVVVAGIRTPMEIFQLREILPECYAELLDVGARLETHFRDVQDVEFTIENGDLLILQTRTGQRTAFAAVRIAVEMVEESLIDRIEAIHRVEPGQLDEFLHPMIDPSAERNVVAVGLSGSPGVAVGRAVFTADDAEDWSARGEDVILIRAETSPEDIGGMHVAQGILTSRGGMASHASVVARGMGKPCVAGAGALYVDSDEKLCRVEGSDTVIAEGDWLSIDASSGEVMVGSVPRVQPMLGGCLGTLLSWADEMRTLIVRATADTPEDARQARELGAQGIGLCRTEHMFFGEDRIRAVRERILAIDEDDRRRALESLLPMHRADFEGIFEAMDGWPVTIRLLAPPLHEFLPLDEEAQEELADELDVPLGRIRELVGARLERNPMMGHRGCRLGITDPDLYEMQARAIAEAALAVQKRGIVVYPEILIPFASTAEELRKTREIIVRVFDEVFEFEGIIDLLVGAVLQTPRACLTADGLAGQADLLAFASSSLTELTFGYSRDDCGFFLPHYVEQRILPEDPFVSIDTRGMGQLLSLATSGAKSRRPSIALSIHGEHASDPASIRFFHETGMDQISCSPFRVPIARLAAAQAAVPRSPDPSPRRGTPRR